MKITFHEPKLEREVRDRYDILLGAVATLEVQIMDRVLYKEPIFPIVELALALKNWTEVDLSKHVTFEFNSLESDDEGFLWFRPEPTGWRIGSIHQEYSEVTIWSDDDVRQAIDEFVHEVENWLSRVVGVELQSLNP